MISAPHGWDNRKVRHLFFESSTLGSASTGLPASGSRFIPVYCVITASGVASAAIRNGTDGSSLISIKTTAGGVYAFDYWDDPDSGIIADKALTLDTVAGIGVCSFHVWYVVARATAGADAKVS